MCEIRIPFDQSMASHAEFRRFVNYNDLAALLDCMILFSPWDQEF